MLTPDLEFRLYLFAALVLVFPVGILICLAIDLLRLPFAAQRDGRPLGQALNRQLRLWAQHDWALILKVLTAFTLLTAAVFAIDVFVHPRL